MMTDSCYSWVVALKYLNHVYFHFIQIIPTPQLSKSLFYPITLALPNKQEGYSDSIFSSEDPVRYTTSG